MCMTAADAHQAAALQPLLQQQAYHLIQFVDKLLDFQVIYRGLWHHAAEPLLCC